MPFPGLGGSVRSKCCHAVVRLGYKKLPKTDIRIKMWVCTLCKKRDVDIIPLSELQSQVDHAAPPQGVDETAL